MAMKTAESTFTTTRTVPDIGRMLREALTRAKARSIDDIQSSSGALSNFDDKADIQVVAQGQSLLGARWVVQFYVHDRDTHRDVTLVALGDGGFTRAMNGTTNTVSLSASIKRRDEIAALLQ